MIFNKFPHEYQMDAKDCGPVYQLPPKSYGKLKMPQTVQNYSEDSLRPFLYDCLYADIAGLVRCLIQRLSLFPGRRSALQFRHHLSPPLSSRPPPRLFHPA